MPTRLIFARTLVAAVDRAATPWVLVTSHFPLYVAKPAGVDVANASASYYRGEGAEAFAGLDAAARTFARAAAPGEETVGQLLAGLQSVLDPILYKYKVDVYDAGHIHNYASTWPICYDPAKGTSAACGERNFVHPRGTVHITEGNGGVPGVVGTSSLEACSSRPWCRMWGAGGAHGRFTAWNATHLTYEHVQNNGGAVTDTFTIVKK